MPTATPPHRVVIVGGGFGGLQAAQSLKRANVDVTLVDRHNHHLFQPLLYQVATGGLSPANIAAPLRSILRRQANTTVLQAEVVDFDLANQQVQLADGELPFDSLIVAAGATHSYFGNDHWDQVAPGLKTIENATDIRARVLSAFERAERTEDPAERERLLTFVIVGGGPTGVELAGALSELSRHTLKHDFRRIHSGDAHILLVDAGEHVLSAYPEELSVKAERFLERLDITHLPGHMVTAISPTCVTVKQNEQQRDIATETVLWAAGVQASPLAQKLADATGVEIDRAGRIPIQADLSLPGHPSVMVIGDMAHLEDRSGNPLPGVAPVAVQQGEYAAQRILDRLNNCDEGHPFKYRDYGSMATVGRSLAVADLGKLHFAGFFAWLMWLFIHLMLLVTFQNRVLVLCQWVWSYITHGRSARLITTPAPEAMQPEPETTPEEAVT